MNLWDNEEPIRKQPELHGVDEEHPDRAVLVTTAGQPGSLFVKMR